jgi:hypothetical protein
VSHVVIGLRRQLKTDHQSISLALLLQELAQTPEVLSREYYVALYKGSVVEDFANRDLGSRGHKAVGSRGQVLLFAFPWISHCTRPDRLVFVVGLCRAKPTSRQRLKQKTRPDPNSCLAN